MHEIITVYRTIRNNLINKKIDIPNIKINKYEGWKKTISIEVADGFSITDLFLCIRSYSDCLKIFPVQMLVMMEDKKERGRNFFTESLSIHRIKDMSLTDFSIWYNDRLEKDSKYEGSEIFNHKILFKFYSKEEEELYPKYPWDDSILKEVLSYSINEREEKIKFLLKKISELEEKIQNTK